MAASWFIFLVLHAYYDSNEACSDSYTPCAQNPYYEVCSSNDESLIAFGSDSKWLYRLKSGGIDMHCDDATFPALVTHLANECCKQISDISGVSTLWPVLNTISCGDTIQTYFGSDEFNPQYFKFSTNTQDTYTFRNCGTAYDTVLSLYNDIGTMISNEACADGNDCGNCSMYNNEEFSITLEAGDYYIHTEAYDDNATNGWYYLSVSAAFCPLTTNIPSSAAATTPSPTGSGATQYDAHLNTNQQRVISESVFISHESDGNRTSQVNIIINGSYCNDPVITFKYELIDYDDEGEYLLIKDNDLTILGTCGNGSVVNQCGKWENCFAEPVSLGARRIKMNESYKLYIFESAAVDASCADHHLYSINAELTIICSSRYTLNPTHATVAPSAMLPSRAPLMSSVRIRKHLNIYPINDTITSHNIVIQNTDDNIDTYFEIEIQPHDTDCIYPSILFSFQNIDFDAHYEYLHILDDDEDVIGQCSGYSNASCDAWISCFSSAKYLGTDRINKGDNYTVTIFEPQAIDGLCTAYHHYSIHANLTIQCSDRSAVSSMYPTNIPSNEPTTEPTIKPTTEPTNIPTNDPTNVESNNSTNIQKIEQYIDVYPLHDAETFTTVSIIHVEDFVDTYSNLHFTIYEYQCLDPRVTFVFEKIDVSDEYLEIRDNDGTIIGSCVADADHECNDWIECFAEPKALGVDAIDVDTVHIITVYEPSTLKEQCPHNDSTHANLTIICAASQTTNNPTNIPSNTPTNVPTNNPTYIPSFGPTQFPTDSPQINNLSQVTTKAVDPITSIQITIDTEDDEDENENKSRRWHIDLDSFIFGVVSVVLCCALVLTVSYLRYKKAKTSNIEKAIEKNTLNVRQLARNTVAVDDHDVEITTRKAAKSREMNRNILSQMYARHVLPARIPTKDAVGTKSTVVTKDTVTLTYDRAVSICASSPSNFMDTLAVTPVFMDTSLTTEAPKLIRNDTLISNNESDFVHVQNRFHVTPGSGRDLIHTTVTKPHIFGEPEERGLPPIKRRPVLIVEEVRNDDDENSETFTNESSSFTVNDQYKDEDQDEGHQTQSGI